MNKKTVISILTIIIISAVGVGVMWWQGRPPQQQKYTGPVEKLRIAFTKGEESAPVFFAFSKKYFQKVGLEVEMQEVSSGREALGRVLKGEADVATVADVPIMFKSFERQDFSILATFVTTDSKHRLITRKDSGIISINDLKNKKIGTFVGTSAYFELYSLLAKAGLSFSDVTILNANPSELPQLLVQKEVDAIVIWDPYAANAEKLLLGHSRTLPPSGLYRLNFNLVSRKDFIELHKETLERLMRGIDLAIDFMGHNSEETKNLVASWTEQTVQNLQLDSSSFQLLLDQTLLLTLETQARWAIANKLTDKTTVPNYLDFIYFDALEAVRPEAVTIIH